MKNLLLVLLVFFYANPILGQNKHTTFYDSVGNVTTYEGHWSQVFTGRYKSVYDKKANTKTLSRTTEVEFQAALKKTEKRITSKDRLGKDFENFHISDINGTPLKKSDFEGKVVVINFWFIGCAPCEAERPLLNTVVERYRGNDSVVFLAFARNDKSELTKFLKENPLLYTIIPTDKDYIKTTFQSNSYPVNIVVSRTGKYSYYSIASGIGISTILGKQIDLALKN